MFSLRSCAQRSGKGKHLFSFFFGHSFFMQNGTNETKRRGSEQPRISLRQRRLSLLHQGPNQSLSFRTEDTSTRNVFFSVVSVGLIHISFGRRVTFLIWLQVCSCCFFFSGSETFKDSAFFAESNIR